MQGDHAASPAAIKQWATEQRELLRASKLSPFQLAIATYGLAQFGVDPTDIAILMVGTAGSIRFLTFGDVAQMVRLQPLLFLKSNFGDHIEVHHHIRQHEKYAVFIAPENGEFNSLKFAGGQPATEYSAVWCLQAAILRSGYKPLWEFRTNFTQGVFGPLHAVFLSAESRT
jgi:hypothetical protein